MAFDENQPREPAGSADGGQWTAGDASIAIREAASGKKLSHAVAVYQSTLFDAINNELRFDRPDKYKDIIEKLDMAATDETNEKLYRGLDADFTKGIAKKYDVKDLNDLGELKAKLIGKPIHDKSFMSTTRDVSIAGDFARDKGKGKTTVLQIDGPKKGIEVTNYVTNYRAKKEKEFLIKRGSTLKIKDVSLSKTGKLILYTEIK